MRTTTRRDRLFCLVVIMVTIALHILPTGFDTRAPAQSIFCQARVLATDDARLRTLGVVTTGIQTVTMELLDGPLSGQTVTAHNEILGKMELDKRFQPGDRALAVLTLDAQGDIAVAVAHDFYRLDVELLLFGLFALSLVIFAGWTGAKALLSFVFSAYTIWKLLVPALLSGWNPIVVALMITTLLLAVIIFLVAGLSPRGVVAFLGALLGILATCAMSLLFGTIFRVHGSVLPFSETLLHMGFGHLDLTQIFLAAIFLGCSGAVMDLAMDVATSMAEVTAANPTLTFSQLLRSGLRVGQAVVGTMTTTLLLAYSGTATALLMLLMAQGISLPIIMNTTYVAAEILRTVVGSFGMVLVAPCTALVGALLLSHHPRFHRVPSGH